MDEGPHFVDSGSQDGERITSGQPMHGALATFEDHWWHDNYTELEELEHDRGYEYYRPAFRYGWESYERHHGRSWSDAEPELARCWESECGDSDAKWSEAKRAVRHAFERAAEVFRG